MSFAIGIVIAASAPSADLAVIDAQVAAFVTQSQDGASAAPLPLDRRLRLNPCAGSLSINWRGLLRDTVAVQCPDPGGWRLFVPVSGASPRGTAMPMAPLPVAVSRGDAVSIIVAGAGFALSQPGEAMDSGAVGAWVKVRPAATGSRPASPLRAIVVRPGVVKLPMP